MNKMKFDVKCVKDCLKNNGRVFTVRSWGGSAQESVVEVEGIGACDKYRIGRVSGIKSIERYVKLSGFRYVDEWWNAIARFGANDGYLFLVVKKRGNHV
ncbi:MAG: hypothetical protein Q8L87_19005 [Anaerolineales bacterium]|nr:hypothetical protein [Anaerolineales bacterium]